MSRKKEKRIKKRIKFFKNIKYEKIIFRLIYAVLVICILCNIIFLLNTTITKNDYFSFSGISLFSMETDLMEPEISKNSLVITDRYDSSKGEEIETGDNIAYRVNGKIRINKVFGEKLIDGNIEYQTKSNQNYNLDIETIEERQVIGKVKTVIPGFGTVYNVIKSVGFSIFILVLLVIVFILNRQIYKERRRRKVRMYNQMQKEGRH